MNIVRIHDLFRKKPSENVSYQALDPVIYKLYNNFRPEGAKKLFCYVPFSNMSFSFEGRVLACAYNQKVELGRYPDQTVSDMWFKSAEGNALRDHMEHNDLSYGCKHCKYFVENKKFSGLKPLVFDKYSNYKGRDYPTVLEFELSNTCNYECIMCNGHVSSSIRQNREKLPPIKSVYNDEFVNQLEEFIPYLKEAKFYGGEPFLIPIYFKIWDKMLSLNPDIKIFVITNGSVLNQRVKDLLEKGDFDLAVSMDSTQKEMIEKIRLNASMDQIQDNVAYFNDYCKRRSKNLVISFTLMRVNWQEFAPMIEFCNSIDASLYVSYLKTPPQFAIWNLPTDELIAIYDQIKDVTFQVPKLKINHLLGANIEKINAQCFEDFKTYLINAIETSKTRDQMEIIPMNPSPANDPPVNQSITDFELQKDVKIALHDTLTSISSLEESTRLMKKLERLVSELSFDIEKVYPIILKSPDREILEGLRNQTDEELKSNITLIAQNLHYEKS